MLRLRKRNPHLQGYALSRIKVVDGDSPVISNLSAHVILLDDAELCKMLEDHHVDRFFGLIVQALDGTWSENKRDRQRV